jgi:hypothetical protein
MILVIIWRNAMKLSGLESIIHLAEECKKMYDEFVMPENRGFKSKLPEIRKKLAQIKEAVTPAKKETILKKDK